MNEMREKNEEIKCIEVLFRNEKERGMEEKDGDELSRGESAGECYCLICVRPLPLGHGSTEPSYRSHAVSQLRSINSQSSIKTSSSFSIVCFGKSVIIRIVNLVGSDCDCFFFLNFFHYYYFFGRVNVSSKCGNV